MQLQENDKMTANSIARTISGWATRNVHRHSNLKLLNASKFDNAFALQLIDRWGEITFWVAKKTSSPQAHFEKSTRELLTQSLVSSYSSRTDTSPTPENPSPDGANNAANQD